LISAMPRPRPPHLHLERKRGRSVWYVRKGKGPRYRLRAEYGSDAFKTEYEDALAGRKLRRSQAMAGSLQWLWDAYRKSDAWKALAPATRRQRENIMLHVLRAAGSEPFAAIREGDIVDGLDRRAETPSAARNFLDTMRGLYGWARSRGHVRTDPTAGVKPPRRRRTSGYAPWTHEDVAAYQAMWPLGTRQRVWLDVLLYTGLRRGDAAMIGNQHVSEEGIISLKTEKTGTPVIMPMLVVLQRSLLAGPRGKAAWIVGERGNPFVKEAFGNAFAEAASAAGVQKSAHGVRKIAATIAAENGATEAELDAIFGWTGGRMSSLYTKQANRARLASQAMTKLNSIPSQQLNVRGKADKLLTYQPHKNAVVGEAEVQSPNQANGLDEKAGK
jgi:site-specific recombinase XerD